MTKLPPLDAGADDYLSKPFGIGELQARLRVALRRHGAAQADEPVVRFADLEVNIPARRILRGSEEIHLTPIEFRLLAALLNNPGKVLTQRQLLNQVWGLTPWSTATICGSIWVICDKSWRPIRHGRSIC